MRARMRRRGPALAAAGLLGRPAADRHGRDHPLVEQGGEAEAIGALLDVFKRQISVDRVVDASVPGGSTEARDASRDRMSRASARHVPGQRRLGPDGVGALQRERRRAEQDAADRRRGRRTGWTDVPTPVLESVRYDDPDECTTSTGCRSTSTASTRSSTTRRCSRRSPSIPPRAARPRGSVRGRRDDQEVQPGNEQADRALRAIAQRMKSDSTLVAKLVETIHMKVMLVGRFSYGYVGIAGFISTSSWTGASTAAFAPAGPGELGRWRHDGGVRWS